jgi:hypothetical protein
MINSVTTLTIASGTFARISYDLSSEMSVNLDNPSDAVASLFAAADAEFEHARDTMRRAMVMRSAAWHLSKQRTAAAAA